ncbi:MAG: hypothetical protein ACW980_24730 [Promethearchaeota archaeon]|jgi:hypothetical protein
MGFFTRIGLAHRKAKLKSGSSTKGLKRKKGQSKPKNDRGLERSFLMNKNFSGKRYKRDKVFKTKDQALKRRNEVKNTKFVRISSQKKGFATYIRKK